VGGAAAGNARGDAASAELCTASELDAGACELRFGQMNKVGQDRGLCLVASFI
jgi:hypothetical protein